MVQFSKKERLIASLLSTSPTLKRVIKNIYVRINAILYNKNYKFIIYNNKINKIFNIEPLSLGDETFFGYYDKSPENNHGEVIFNETTSTTSKKPTANKQIWIRTINLKNKATECIGLSFSYNWQQGCRVQWVTDEKLIYNVFEKNSYKSILFNTVRKTYCRTYEYPIQDGYKDEYFLSINYQRVMALRPDYGYRNLPLLDNDTLKETDNDGIWKVDYSLGEGNLILTLSDIIKFVPNQNFSLSLHKVNHIMISPNGEKFIFIHRWYEGGRRHDRLLLFDFKNLTVVADENMVSHMCWINDTTLFGYLRHDSKDGFFFIDLNDLSFTPCDTLNALGHGDGHPSCHGDWIVFDTYPDKSRHQHLYLYNINSKEICHLLELHQKVKYQGECRCDLHPRFSPNGNRIYFDTVYTGERRLAYIDVSKITNP